LKSVHFKLLSIILISCLGIIIYSNTFHCSFHFDDQKSITDNAFIKNIADLQSIWNFLPRRFILYLSIALNYHFNQLNVFGYHLFNLCIHLISAILVWWLTLLTLSTPAIKGWALEKNTSKKKSLPKSTKPLPVLQQSPDAIVDHAPIIALLTGLIFVSHPVQTEAVTYIVQRAASMATMFYIVTLCLYIKSRISVGAGSKTAPIYYTCALITAIIAMFTKETAITLPLMILLYEYYFLKTKKEFNWGYCVPFLLTIFIIPTTMYFTESLEAQHLRGVGADSPAGISSWNYLLTQFRVIITYIRLIFLPFNQNLDYDYAISKGIFELPTLLSFLFLITILASTKFLFSKYRILSFSILWFFLALLPESSLLPIKDVIFEHRLYLPLVGYCLFLVSGVYYLLGKKNITAMIIILTTIVVGNSLLTYERNKVWKNDFTIWNDTIGKSPHKARPYNGRGLANLDQGKISQAEFDFSRAIELDPAYADAYYNRGLLYAKQKKFAQANADLTKASSLSPDYAEAYYSRGLIDDKEGNFTAAILNYSKAIEQNSKYAENYYNRGCDYLKEGDFTQSDSDFDKTIELNPNLAEAYYNRANSYFKQREIEPAMSDYNKAIELQPQYAEAYYNRGLLYAKLNNSTQAMSDYNEAIELNANFADAYNNRGLLFDNEGNFTQALSDYNKAIKLNPNFAGVFYNRAITFYHLKEFDYAWRDVHKLEKLGAPINPALINALEQASGKQQ